MRIGQPFRVSGCAALSPWAYDQAHGPSPHHHDFGANRYVVDTTGHSDYWKPESESLFNQAAIVVGRYSLVGREHGQTPPDLPREEHS